MEMEALSTEMRDKMRWMCMVALGLGCAGRWPWLQRSRGSSSARQARPIPYEALSAEALLRKKLEGQEYVIEEAVVSGPSACVGRRFVSRSAT